MPSLFPPDTFPYIIVTPSYNPASAGNRALHLLCHSLNQTGHRAYLSIFPQVPWEGQAVTCPELCTPVLTQEILTWFEQNGRPPIVLYAETVFGNPLNAPLVVRWVLNYPGLLGGDKTYDPAEIVYAYSRRLAQSVGLGDDRVIFLPTSDSRIFYPPPAGTPRQGSCFYAAKYQTHHQGKLLPLTANSIEITRDGPGAPSKQQIAELFRRCELFYTYEDTALAIEAGMCGCPTVFIPNEHLTDPLGFDDLGRDGFAWGAAADEIAKAKDTVHKFAGNYEALIARYWSQLEHFAAHTQAVARERHAAQPNPPVMLLRKGLKNYLFVAGFIISYIKRNGWQKFWTKAQIGIRKRGLGKMVGNSCRNLLGG